MRLAPLAAVACKSLRTGANALRAALPERFAQSVFGGLISRSRGFADRCGAEPIAASCPRWIRSDISGRMTSGRRNSRSSEHQARPAGHTPSATRQRAHLELSGCGLAHALARQRPTVLDDRIEHRLATVAAVVLAAPASPAAARLRSRRPSLSLLTPRTF